MADNRARGAINDGFCPDCDVSLDLHDGPDTCKSAGMKADLLRDFWGVFGRSVPAPSEASNG
ncbi:MAG TPA: hypothetical protein VIL68_02535 [Propionibacteriaceae bacterium]